MTPEQISVLTSIVTLVKMLSSWPVIGILLLMIVGPWVMAMFLFSFTSKRFEAVVSMYESNVKLVEQYEKVSKDLKDVVMVNTSTFSKLTEAIKGNQFCPIVREKGGIT